MEQAIRCESQGPGRRIAFMVARCASGAFALMLLASAWQKSVSPQPAAAALRWLAIESEARLQLVDLTSIAEGLLAGLLVFFFSWLGTHRIALLAVSLLLLAHVLGLVFGVTNCGCFGEVDVPDWVSLTGVVTGGGASLVVLTVKSVTPQWSRRVLGWRAACLLAVSAISVLPQWAREEPSGNAAEQLVARAGLPRAMERALFVIGSRDCPHCREALSRIHAEPSMRSVPVILVTNEEESDGSGQHLTGRLSQLAVPGDLWWRLVPESPPSFVWYRRGRPGSVSAVFEPEGLK